MLSVITGLYEVYKWQRLRRKGLETDKEVFDKGAFQDVHLVGEEISSSRNTKSINIIVAHPAESESETGDISITDISGQASAIVQTDPTASQDQKDENSKPAPLLVIKTEVQSNDRVSSTTEVEVSHVAIAGTDEPQADFPSVKDPTLRTHSFILVARKTIGHLLHKVGFYTLSTILTEEITYVASFRFGLAVGAGVVIAGICRVYKLKRLRKIGTDKEVSQDRQLVGEEISANTQAVSPSVKNNASRTDSQFLFARNTIRRLLQLLGIYTMSAALVDDVTYGAYLRSGLVVVGTGAVISGVYAVYRWQQLKNIDLGTSEEIVLQVDTESNVIVSHPAVGQSGSF